MKEEFLMRSGVKGLNVQWTELLYEPRMGKLLFFNTYNTTPVLCCLFLQYQHQYQYCDIIQLTSK